jgi:signal transduction histidine kinase
VCENVSVMTTPISKTACVFPALAIGSAITLAAAGLADPFARLLAGFLAILLLPAAAILAFRRTRHREAGVNFAAAALLASVAAFNWPLQLSYLFARSDFERIAAQARAGVEIATPVRVGLIMIHKVEVRRRMFERVRGPLVSDDTDARSIACLWTNTNPGGYTGFVQTAPDRLQFNIFSHVRLDARWQFISED